VPKHLSHRYTKACQAPEARTWRLTELHRRLRISFHPGASSVVQRDENHSVAGQGCKEDGPVPLNCSAVTTHACGWPLSTAMHQTQTCFRDMTLAPYTSDIWSHYAPQCLTVFLPAPPSYKWRWDSTTDMRRGMVSVRGSSALPALTWQGIWMK
jgi:hypothetical protein